MMIKLKEKRLRLLSAIVISLLVVNLALFAMKIINLSVFWAVISLAAIFAYNFLPKKT